MNGMSINNKYSKYLKEETTDNNDQIRQELTEYALRLKHHGIALVLEFDDFCSDQRKLAQINAAPKGVIIPYHSHRFYEVNYVTYGTCYQYIGDECLTLEAGDALLISPSVSHSLLLADHTETINLLLRPQLFEDFSEKCAAYSKNNRFMRCRRTQTYLLYRTGTAQDALNALIRRMLSDNGDSAADNCYTNLVTEIHCLEFLLELEHRHTVGEAHSLKSRPNADADNIGIMLDYIRENYAHITLEGAAAHFGYSPTHLHRLIKKQTGSGFSTFINTQRLSHAKQLLTDTQLPVKRIAEIVGIRSPEYFSRMFAREMHMTPKNYRYTKNSPNRQ